MIQKQIPLFFVFCLFSMKSFEQTSTHSDKNVVQQQTNFSVDTSAQKTIYSPNLKILYHANKGQSSIYTPDSLAQKKIDASHAQINNPPQISDSKNNKSDNPGDGNGKT